MTALLSFADGHPGLSFVALCFAGFALWSFCDSLRTIAQRTTHVHHHHSEGCRENHEKGPCES